MSYFEDNGYYHLLPVARYVLCHSLDLYSIHEEALGYAVVPCIVLYPPTPGYQKGKTHGCNKNSFVSRLLNSPRDVIIAMVSSASLPARR